MSITMKISSRNLPLLRRRSIVKGGMAGLVGLAPTIARGAHQARDGALLLGLLLIILFPQISLFLPRAVGAIN